MFNRRKFLSIGAAAASLLPFKSTSEIFQTPKPVDIEKTEMRNLWFLDDNMFVDGIASGDKVIRYSAVSQILDLKFEEFDAVIFVYPQDKKELAFIKHVVQKNHTEHDKHMSFILVNTSIESLRKSFRFDKLYWKSLHKTDELEQLWKDVRSDFYKDEFRFTLVKTGLPSQVSWSDIKNGIDLINKVPHGTPLMSIELNRKPAV